MANAYPAAPPANTTAVDPGKTFGIVALIVSIFASLIGGILGIVAYSKSKKAGFKNKFALAAIIVGFTLFVIQAIVGVLIAVAAIGIAADPASVLCEGQAPGTYETTTGEMITCE
jgi:cation transporter-like permease